MACKQHKDWHSNIVHIHPPSLTARADVSNIEEGKLLYMTQSLSFMLGCFYIKLHLYVALARVYDYEKASE